MAYDFNKWVTGDRMARKPWLPWYLGLCLVLAIVYPILEMVDTDDEGHAVANLAPLLFLIIGTSLSPFARSTWSEAGVPDFDEREHIVLAHATRRAYSVFLGVVLASGTWLWIASLNGWMMPRSPADWSVWACSLLAIGVALPILFAEIMVPLPPVGEEHDLA